MTIKIFPLWKRGSEGDLLHIAPSIPSICQNPSFSPFVKWRELRSGSSFLYLQIVFASFSEGKMKQSLQCNLIAPSRMLIS
jgi:hypothetical protein